MSLDYLKVWQNNVKISKTNIFRFITELGKKVEEKGADGKGGTVGTQLAEITKALVGAGGTDGIKKDIETAITTAQGGQNKANLDISTKFNALKTAITAATDAIDEKLESGDLTQLDTSNLKALRSSINDIQSQLETTFTDLGLKFDTNNADVPLDKLKELQETLKNGVLNQTQS